MSRGSAASPAVVSDCPPTSAARRKFVDGVIAAVDDENDEEVVVVEEEDEDEDKGELEGSEGLGGSASTFSEQHTTFGFATTQCQSSRRSTRAGGKGPRRTDRPILLIFQSSVAAKSCETDPWERERGSYSPIRSGAQQLVRQSRSENCETRS